MTVQIRPTLTLKQAKQDLTIMRSFGLRATDETAADAFQHAHREDWTERNFRRNAARFEQNLPSANHRTAETLLRLKQVGSTLTRWFTLSAEAQAHTLPDVQFAARFGHDKLRFPAQEILNQWYLSGPNQSKGWERWEQVPGYEETCGYTLEPDDPDCFIVEAGSYLRLTDEETGEVDTIGYDFLRSMFDWANDDLTTDLEGPYTQPATERVYRAGKLIETRVLEAPEANAQWRQANDRISYADEDEVGQEDRGYEPPGFGNPIPIHWDAVQMFRSRHEDALTHLVDVYVQFTAFNLTDDLRLDMVARLAPQERFALARTLAGDIRANMSTKYARYLRILNNRLTLMRPHLQYRETRIRYARHKALRDKISARWAHVRDYDGNVERLVELFGIEAFFDEWEDELLAATSGDHHFVTSERDIEEMAERVLEEYMHAPVARIPEAQLQQMWSDPQTRSQFPSPEKVRTEKRVGSVSFWLYDDTDYITLARLLKLQGLDLGGAVHSLTPFKNRAVMDHVLNGENIVPAYKAAHAEYMAERALRHPKQAAPQTTSRKVAHLLDFTDGMFILDVPGRPAKAPAEAVEKMGICLTDEHLAILTKALAERPDSAPIRRIWQRITNG
ncbi:hypothetical protein [Aggregatilinea lenta]|uniref:hypothetical protein n=1 Tax=Aggregatilinea lenta TaxID=913108 RepID=UPI000E5B745A|nr:hypothetical protein [Aggregatilinea lenta]